MSIFSKIKNLFIKKQEKDEAGFQSLFTGLIKSFNDAISVHEKRYKSPLDNCPFCGGGVSTMANYEVDGTMFVMCNTCRTMVFFPNQPKTLEEIKPNWNHRAVESGLRAEIARLRKGK